jgi:O-acetyl-ADP-ribose deacetylase (regulator of RNase III)
VSREQEHLPDLRGRSAATYIRVGGNPENGGVPTITAVQADITTVTADAIVNAASKSMGGGGGGVNGAIHRAGGPAILAECAERYPNGLAVGAAGWTTAGDLPARWVIHTVGPNYSAGQHDRGLLRLCYRRGLDLADELGARTVAFPLIGTGSYGWPRSDAIAVAVEAIATSGCLVDHVQLVAVDQEAYEEVGHILARSTPLRILQGVRALHRRGYQWIRIRPGMSPSGMHWRVSIMALDKLSHVQGDQSVSDWDRGILYSSGSGTDFAGSGVTVTTSPDQVADIILAAMPALRAIHSDAEYARWYDELVSLVERHDTVPIAYADYFDGTLGWELGWGSGRWHRHPPDPRR